MKVVTPVHIDDSRLISSNITDTYEVFDEEKEYKALDYCMVGKLVYQAAVGMDTTDIPEYDPLGIYLTGDRVKVLADNAVYGAISGAITNDFLPWDATHLYFNGNYCQIASAKKIYLSHAGENPADYPEWSSHTLTLTGVTGTFVIGETITGAGDSGSGVINGITIDVDIVTLTLKTVTGTFLTTDGEDEDTDPDKVLVTGGTSGATGTSDTLSTFTYDADVMVKITPVYALNAGNVANQIRIYKSKKANNSNKFPPTNLTGSVPFWALVGTCNLNAPPDTSVLYTEWSATTNYTIGSVCKVQNDGAAFVALTDHINKPPSSNLIGSAPSWKRLESFDVNCDSTNYLWSVFDTINMGHTPSVDVIKKTPVAWKKLGICNVDMYPPDNIHVAATSSTEAVGSWYKIGSTNKWKMFDDSISTASIKNEYIEVLLDWTWCDTVALFNLSALNVQLTLLVGEEVVHDENVSTFVDDYTSWTEVFFKEPEFVGNIYRVMPATFGAQLKIRINSIGGTAKCGHCVIGLGKHIGKSQYGLKSGIADYSKINTDEFGDTTFSKGKYAVTADVDLWVNRGTRPAIRRHLEDRRATPLVWHMDNEDINPDSDLVLFGFYKEFFTTIENSELDGCAISVTGLA